MIIALKCRDCDGHGTRETSFRPDVSRLRDCPVCEGRGEDVFRCVYDGIEDAWRDYPDALRINEEDD